MAWTVRFYRDLNTGEEPAKEWLDSLAGNDEVKRLAALAAIECVLKVHGVDVCESEWGKNLGHDTYELRIRHPAPTIVRMFPLAAAIKKRFDRATQRQTSCCVFSSRPTAQVLSCCCVATTKRGTLERGASVQKSLRRRQWLPKPKQASAGGSKRPGQRQPAVDEHYAHGA